MALDSSGAVYVVDFSNHRVEKFDPNGGPSGEEAEFLLSFGATGTGDGQFSWKGLEFSSFIDVGPSDTVYVGDQGRIQSFDSDGNFLNSIPLPGESVQALGVDSAGKLYVSYFKEISGDARAKEDVLKLDPTNPSPVSEPLCTAKVKEPRALTVDAADNLYVVDGLKEIGAAMQIRKFDPSCKEVIDATFPFADGFNASTGIATNTVTQAGAMGLYVSNFSTNPTAAFVRAYYPAPDRPLPFAQPPVVPPTIASQYAATVDTASAVLKAQINPFFWKDTSYRLEYGTGECSLGGCNVKPAAPGTQLGAGIVRENVTTPGIILSGLQPNTTYHYRFVAQSSGGGPVRGVGGTEGLDGAEGTFTTFPTPQALPGCPNAAFRSGAGSALPDCRAYEQVSPPDRAVGDIEVLEGNYLANFPHRVKARLDQATPDGAKITYSATPAYESGTAAAPWSSQYLARRDPAAGWSSRDLNFPRSDVLLNSETNTENSYKNFSKDLCNGWLLQETDRTLVGGAPPKTPNLYRRELCNSDAYELLTSVAPSGARAHDSPLFSFYYPTVQGATPDSAHTFIRANTPLTADASSKEVYQLYETDSNPFPGEKADLTLVSVLPNGSAAGVHSSLGTAAGAHGEFRSDSVNHAVSVDGSRVFWTASTTPEKEEPVPPGGRGLQPGNLYLRANPLAPQSTTGACDEPEKACSLLIAGPNAEFWTANPTGTVVIYQVGSTLFEAEVKAAGKKITAKSTPIAEGVVGMLGASEDASRIYLTSTQSLASGAAAGKPNLYLYEKGVGFTFVGTLAALDSNHFDYPSVDNIKPGIRRARVSADGLHVVFVAIAPLTGFDNADLSSGQKDSQVFLYDAPAATGGAGSLACVSCNFAGTRPIGRKVGNDVSGQTEFWAAGQIPGWESQIQAARVLSSDGNRLFFESFDALLPGDTNGAKDVYEWERASGQGACNALGATLFVPGAGGCISLISTGTSGNDSEFIDASADGNDVFFTTAQSLVPDDKSFIDLYDARAGGGFPSKPVMQPCKGEACQAPGQAPEDSAPASSIVGPGNVKSTANKCPKGKHRVKNKKTGKARCAKNKPKKARKSSQSRRAAR